LRRTGHDAGSDRRAWHTIFAALAVPALFSADIGYIFLAASAEAERTLMRGFTTVRDLRGPSFALKQAIDDGLVPGPRIYPSGAMITTTGGHGDLRPLSDLPRSPGGPLSYMERTGAANIADSADEVGLRVREQLLQGASQIKLVGGGGVASPRTTLDMFTFSQLEFRAGVEAAAHLRGRARLPAGSNPAGDRRGGPVHRARPSDGRGDGQAHGGKGHMAQHATLRQR
jgi:hypothetical protein